MFGIDGSTRETVPTGVAVDQLLEALARLDNRPDGLRELATHCLTAAHLAERDGQADQATVWAQLVQLVLCVAEDRVDTSGNGGAS